MSIYIEFFTNCYLYTYAVYYYVFFYLVKNPFSNQKIMVRLYIYFCYMKLVIILKLLLIKTFKIKLSYTIALNNVNNLVIFNNY